MVEAAVERYVQQGFSRLHMPGHKGAAIFSKDWGNAAAYDVTEVAGLDSLYACSGCLRELERAFAAEFQAGDSLLSAGGSTLCIQAMLGTFCSSGGTVLAARGLHRSALSAMGLLDLRPLWMYPQTRGIFTESIAPFHLEEALSANPQVQAVYVTSPDYWGHVSDIKGLAAVCHRYGKPLLVDNAHGAHLRLTSLPHPMTEGADACADGLHKSLPALTGAAVLHLREGSFYQKAKSMMALFGSTSPSYLIMTSAETALRLCKGDGLAATQYAIERMNALSALSEEKGFPLPPMPRDHLKLCLDYTDASKETVQALFEKHKLSPEYFHGGICLFMATGCNHGTDFDRLERFLADLPRPNSERTQEKPAVFGLPRCPQAKTPREALFAQKRRVCTIDSVGRIAAELCAPCPPGIPVVAPGERITDQAAVRLAQYGVTDLDVIDEDTI